MNRRFVGCVSFAIAVLVAVAGARQQGGYDLFQQALSKERSEGRLAEAVALYDRITREFASDRALAAKALLGMGRCYEKLGAAQSAEARKAYERIVTQFADQKDVAAEARKRLGARSVAAPVEAGLVERHVWSFPPSGTYRWLSGVSADGHLVAVADSTKVLLPRVYLLDLTTGQDRTVTDNTHCFTVYLSPDAKQLACGWSDDGTGGISLRVIQIGDGSMRTVWRAEGRAISVHGWSPDGKRILARTRKNPAEPWEMVLVSVADGSVNVLKTGGGVGFGSDGSGEPRFSPDGRFIVYPAARAGGDGKPVADGAVRTLRIMPAAGGTETPLVEGAATEADWSPAWTPDGRRVVFISNRSGAAAVWAVTVTDGRPVGEPERLKMNVDSEGSSLLGFAPDGTLYGLRTVFASDVLLAELDPDSGRVVREPKRVNQTHVGRTGGGISWSPDGQWLAYNSFLNSQTTLVVHSMDTGEDRELPQASTYFYVAGWFPGGQSLLAGNKRIDVTSGREESIPGLEREPVNLKGTSIGLSHDGKSVYYSVDDGDAVKNNGLYTVRLIRHDVGTGQKRELYRTTSPLAGLHSVAVSPDDRLVAFGETRAFAEGGVVVKVIPAEGGEAREVSSKAWWGAGWGADGKHLLLRGAGTDGQGQFVWVPVDGGPARSSGLRCGGLWFAVHPDGRHVAFVDGSDPQDEIVAIKNLLVAQKPAR
jgi:Tol biopolymer transport system component